MHIIQHVHASMKMSLPCLSQELSLSETKSEHQWPSKPTRSKTASEYMLTFTKAYENRSQTWRKT